MLFKAHTGLWRRLITAIFGSLVLAALSVVLVAAAATVIQISSDPFTNSSSQHATQVEPDTFSNGLTIVSAVQSGRFFSGGGASDISWATSSNRGTTWSTGTLNCITGFQFNNCGTLVQYDRVSDPAVAYDAKFNTWLISSLPIKNGIGAGVLVSRSADGLNWDNPVTVHASGDFHDKDWIVCDNTPTSPFYGNCYVEWDDNSLGNRIEMNTSTDGGLTWSPARPTANSATGIGGQPVVQPGGKVIVPIDNAFEGSVLAFTSSDGGTTWSSTVTIKTIASHGDAGGIRSGPLPSAEIDASGKVYVVWADCRFRTSCASNDIVMSTSSDGVTWSPVTRIPIDPKTSTVDHFIPGIAVDNTTSGTTAHLALTYYYYPTSNCTATTCQLDVGFVQSKNGGANWSRSIQLAGPMTLNWLANTDQGRMVGDYISTSISGGKSIPGFVKANAPTGGVFDEALYSVLRGITAPLGGQEFSSAGEQPVPNAASDHPLPTRPINTIQPIQ